MCEADANIRVFSIQYDIITLVYTWATGAPSNQKSLVFFPNSTNAIFSSDTASLRIIYVASTTSISTVFTLSLALNFYQTDISPSGTKALTVTNSQNEIIYLIATTTSLAVQQTISLATGGGLIGVNFVVENIALVVATGSGVQKYIVTSTTIIFASVVLSASNYFTLTFFPGSKSQGYISNSVTSQLQVFQYSGNTMTIIKSLFTGYATQTTQIVNSNPYSRLVAIQLGYFQLYSLCSMSGCNSGGCDWNGNCLNGCSTSTPARIAPKCTCPTGYIDNGIDAQCELAYDSTQQANLLSSTS